MLKIVKKEYVAILEWAFKIVYLLLGLATFNAFLYSSPIQPVLVEAALILGILTLIGRALYFQDYVTTPYWIVLALFCGSFLVTILVNYSYGQSMADFKWLIWTGLIFFLLYVTDRTRKKESYQKEFSVLAHIMIVYGTVAAALGILLMFQLYQKAWYTANGEQMLAGFFWGRLWGVYTDPNYGGVFSVVVILLSVYFCMAAKSWRKLFYIVAVIANYVYVAYSNSRTAEVGLVVSVAFWILYTLAYRLGRGKGLLIGIILSALFAAVFLSSTSYLKSQSITPVQKGIETEKHEPQPPPNPDAPVPNGNTAVGREEDLKKDVSNGRISLWKSGIEIWKTKPILGTGYNSFLPYVKQTLPKTYAVHNPQGDYVSLHNAYLNVLVYQGLVGEAVLLTFLILVVRRWCLGLRTLSAGEQNYRAILTACVLVIGVSMIFLLEGVYTNSPGCFILWTFLGYMMHDITESQKVEKQA